MKCIAIDDEPLALSVIRKYVGDTPALKLLHTFEDAVEGLEFLKNSAVDLLFIDINMPDLSGLELVAGLEHRPMIIFTTAHKKFAHEGFELEAIDYLLKPISFERFSKAVQKAFERQEYLKTRQQEDAFIIVRSEYKMIKVQLAEVEFIEGMEDYIKIHLQDAKHPVLTLLSLKNVLEMLPEKHFSRIHRSYIISHSKIKSIQNKKVKLQSGRELPVSDSYLDFIDKWKNH